MTVTLASSDDTALREPGRRRPSPHLMIPALHLLGAAGVAAAWFVGGPHPLTLAAAVTAYGLGLRHAFDSDHIAAIDTTTRRLARAGTDARAVGLWFSLGHSTVVVVLSMLLASGLPAVVRAMHDGSAVHAFTGVWGPTVSGTFLLALAVTNAVLLGRRLRSVRTPGRSPEEGTAAPATAGGPVSWLVRRLGWLVDRPARMFLVGLLFGLGFDTATEIGLLALAATAGFGHAAWLAILPLPVLFAAGMSTLDAAQGAMARRAYAHADVAPSGRRRSLPYDVAVTGVSATVAAGVGLVELARVAADRQPALAWLPGAHLDLEPYGLVLTAAVVLAWGVVVVAGRFTRLGPDAP